MPIMMKRLGDSAPRTRSIVSDNIVTIANSKELKVTTLNFLVNI